eukprot:140477-Prymnesium_polylepis.2
MDVLVEQRREVVAPAVRVARARPVSGIGVGRSRAKSAVPLSLVPQVVGGVEHDRARRHLGDEPRQRRRLSGEELAAVAAEQAAAVAVQPGAAHQ